MSVMLCVRVALAAAVLVDLHTCVADRLHGYFDINNMTTRRPHLHKQMCLCQPQMQMFLSPGSKSMNAHRDPVDVAKVGVVS